MSGAGFVITAPDWSSSNTIPQFHTTSIWSAQPTETTSGVLCGHWYVWQKTKVIVSWLASGGMLSLLAGSTPIFSLMLMISMPCSTLLTFGMRCKAIGEKFSSLLRYTSDTNRSCAIAMLLNSPQ